ncbi:MAG: translesion DNA synthesis-associated protein ImuA [Betaproteobacteria bacterium]|nr:translesion DNA synthesis-associated protein ImuA [Betaproteobacteria bacterium]
MSALQQLLQHPALWRGNECARVALPSIPTGFQRLDAVLPGGGWPRGALAEVNAEREGIGEMSLLVPALARLSREEERWLALVNPPRLPYAPALAAGGVALPRLLIVRTESSADALWAAEQALRSGACSAVIAWAGVANERSLRRLQLAAETGEAWGVHSSFGQAATSSPAPLRLRVFSKTGEPFVHVLKRRGGGSLAPFALDAPLPGREGVRPAFACPL